ncbi:DinB family protein [Gramella sp. KN1008]|uniref:DinB family protein n=1 Tax=Gramella sp. KN1008 TaxID=2529298 RepID=UPI00103AE7B9|nr:DinB family protein [Gramella sp. KN1008]TBW26545.1 DinB family protein [Gramella sp. KN1008]
MTVVLTEELIEDLLKNTKASIQYVRNLQFLSYTELNYRIEPNWWTILECLEHLNMYTSYYLPEIRKAINLCKPNSHQEFFESHWIGDYIANQMLPKEGMRKIKTLRNKDPKGQKLDLEVIKQFLADQHKILELLIDSKSINLMSNSVPFSMCKILKLKIGDALRIVVNHNLRHLEQIKKLLRTKVSGKKRKELNLFMRNLEFSRSNFSSGKKM